MNAEKAIKDDSNSSKHIPVEGTPFVIRKYPDTGWFATLGKHRVTDEEPSEEILKKQIENKDWNLICAVMAVIKETKIPD